MTDLWAVSEADLPHALAVASYVSRTQRAALDALPQWQRPHQQQGPSATPGSAHRRAAPPPPAADDSPPLQFMNAQDAPAFGDVPSDGDGGELPFAGGPAMRATPTASPVPALFETQPRGVAAGKQTAGGDSKSKSRHTSMTAQLTYALPQTQAPFDSQPEVGSLPQPSPGGTGGQPAATAQRVPPDVGLAAVAEEADEELAPPAPAAAKAKKRGKGKATKKAAPAPEAAAGLATQEAAAPVAPAPAPRVTSTPDVADDSTQRRPVRSSILPGTQPPEMREQAPPPPPVPAASPAAPPAAPPAAAPAVASPSAGARPPAARPAASFLAALGITDVAAEVRNAVKKQRLQ